MYARESILQNKALKTCEFECFKTVDKLSFVHLMNRMEKTAFVEHLTGVLTKSYSMRYSLPMSKAFNFFGIARGLAIVGNFLAMKYSFEAESKVMEKFSLESSSSISAEVSNSDSDLAASVPSKRFLAKSIFR
jgi:hypothetical protein